MAIEVRSVCTLILVFDMPPAPDPRRNAVHEDTCLYFACPDVDAAYRHLRGKGIDMQEPRIAHYGMKQLYVRDPDGYNLCFQSDHERASR